MLPERPLRKESSSRKCGERDFEYDRRCVVCREISALQSVIVRRIRPPGDSREGFSESVWTGDIQDLKEDDYIRSRFIG
jgi:hypothetical protein